MQILSGADGRKENVTIPFLLHGSYYTIEFAQCVINVL